MNAIAKAFKTNQVIFYNIKVGDKLCCGVIGCAGWGGAGRGVVVWGAACKG